MTRGDRGPVEDGTVRPYRVIDTRTRRRAGGVYLVMAVLAAGLIVTIGLEAMWITAVVPIVLVAAFQIVTAWSMPITDMQAIRIAGDAASFEVGHGSATLGYRGPLAKPVWQVLAFSDSPSPDRQALVTVDARSGAVTGRYEEEIPLP